MKTLIVIDMQNDFIDGVFGTKEAQTIIPNVVKKIDNFDGNLVIATRDTHAYEYSLEKKQLPAHCIEGTEGHKLNKDVATSLVCSVTYPKTSIVIDKNTFGCFDIIQELSKDISNKMEIEVIGLVTDICVISNVLMLRSAFPQAKIIVDASCCAGTTPEAHEMALQIMKNNLVEVI